MMHSNKIFFFILIALCSSLQLSAQTDILTVQEAIRQAIANNFGIAIQRNESEIAQINNNWAYAGAIPQISATATKTIGVNNLEQHLSNGTITKKNGNTSQGLNAGVAINWRVFDGFKMFATKRKLEELERGGAYAFRKNINETVYNVISTYYNIVTLNEQLQATREQIELYNNRYTLAQRRFEIGTGAKYEVLETQVDLNEQQSNLLSFLNAIALEKTKLYNYMGKRPDTAYTVADTILVQPLPLFTEVQQQIDTGNADLLLASSDLAVLMETRKEINAARLPSVDLGAYYNFGRSRNGAGFTLLNQTYGPSGSVGISIPLFSGMIVKKQLQVADLQIASQQIEILRVKNDVLTALSNAYINYNNALKTIALEKDNLKLAAENISIATERYKVLNITAVELRQIQISYYAVKNRLFNALLQAKLAETGIALLTGQIAQL